MIEGYQYDFLNILDNDPAMIANAKLWNQQQLDAEDKRNQEAAERSRVYNLEYERGLREYQMIQSEKSRLIGKINRLHRETIDMQLELAEKVRQARMRYLINE